MFMICRVRTVTAVAVTALGAVSFGYVPAHANWIPCDLENSTLYATTPNSDVEVCSVNGSWVYQGRRLSDGATMVVTDVAVFPNANKIEAYNEGWTYSLRRDGFHLIDPSGVDNYEPWIAVRTWNVPD
jgi:hypothetical protein